MYILGRFIVKNSRMAYITIEQCEIENKQGPLLILDFSEAWNTIEWALYLIHLKNILYETF